MTIYIYIYIHSIKRIQNFEKQNKVGGRTSHPGLKVAMNPLNPGATTLATLSLAGDRTSSHCWGGRPPLRG
jgi:hypothetical protein